MLFICIYGDGGDEDDGDGGDEDDGDDDGDDDSHDDDDETTQTRLSARPTQGASRNLLISKLPFTTQPLTCIFVFVYLIKHYVNICVNVQVYLY